MGGFGGSGPLENGKFWEASELLRNNISRDRRRSKISKGGYDGENNDFTHFVLAELSLKALVSGQIKLSL